MVKAFLVIAALVGLLIAFMALFLGQYYEPAWGKTIAFGLLFLAGIAGLIAFMCGENLIGFLLRDPLSDEYSYIRLNVLLIIDSAMICFKLF